jgi:hypothetical protein
MNSSKPFHGFLAAAFALSAGALAQNAITKSPTAADWAAMAKLPDFNGVWEAGGGGGGRAGGGGGNAGAARGTAAPAARGTAPPAAGRGRGAGGRGGGQPGPSLTPEYAARAKNMPPPAADGPTANCLPPGLPTIMNQPYPMEFLLTPGKVTIVIEAYTQVRHIYTDGRPLPSDPDPSFYGTSIGHWDNDTLVVETVGFEDVPRGINFPHSERMKIVERFHLTDPDTMTVETSVLDPEALTEPYVMAPRTLKRHRNWTIAEYICEENNRNYVDANGKAGLKLTNPPK